MSLIDKFVDEYFAEVKEQKGSEINQKFIDNSRKHVKRLMKGLHNGSLSLNAVINKEVHDICERILIDDFEHDRLDGRAYRQLLNHYIDAIISDHPSHINFGLNDIPNEKLKDRIIETIISLNNKDENHEFDLSDKDISNIENVIKTRLTFDNNNSRYFFDSSKCDKEDS